MKILKSIYKGKKMNKIEKPEPRLCHYEWNEAIDRSDKYWEQEKELSDLIMSEQLKSIKKLSLEIVNGYIKLSNYKVTSDSKHKQEIKGKDFKILALENDYAMLKDKHEQYIKNKDKRYKQELKKELRCFGLDKEDRELFMERITKDMEVRPYGNKNM